MIKLLVAVVAAVICSSRVEAALRACTWADLDFCEDMLTKYTRDPRNWNLEKKSVLYCDFVKLRLLCLKSLNCDKMRSTEEMPIIINFWINIIESRLHIMVNYDLCSEKSRNPTVVNYEDECDEYYVNKRCTEAISEYLMSRFSLTCVAMMKANPCFSGERARCGLPQPTIGENPLTPGGFVNPNIVIAESGHCKLIYDESDPRFGMQESWRTANSVDYFTYF
ncbi:uncharacterized protein [Ptychodera flava]|uniref:uncharacterized protein n=1 Tax=Ptychodera flava TaxID=63121 RepID=UPI003969FF83